MQQDSLSSDCSQWSDLTTNTTFDEGSTQRVDCVTNNGVIVHDVQHTTTSSLLVASLVEQICNLLEPDPVHKEALFKVICGKLHHMKLIDDTYGIEEFGAIRAHYQRELMHFLQTALSTINNGRDVKSDLLQYTSTNLNPTRSLIQQEIHTGSRYAADFIELQYLAKGGFGEVFRVRHRLDGEEYAVKKICLCYLNKYYFIRSLREVKLLARLNHPNIVSYKAAWLEPLSTVIKKIGREDNRSISQVAHQTSKEDFSNTNESEEDSYGVVFKESSSHLPSESSSITRSEGGKDDRSGESSPSRRALCRFKLDNEDNCPNEWAMLYIQMQLCETTLRQWLDIRNSRSHDVDVRLSISIFRQIVSGIEYVHSQGIVHHDIKPSNIFLNNQTTNVQLGDLGLACIFHHGTQDVRFVNQNAWSIDHRGEIGTKPYAAPEQLKGECNPKSDMYSAGVVLFELIQPFSTDMERSILLTQLKSGDIPSQLHSTYPELVKLIELLTATDPGIRPTAQDLIMVIDSMSVEYSRNDTSETISQLRADLSKKDREIEELKRKVLALELHR